MGNGPSEPATPANGPLIKLNVYTAAEQGMQVPGFGVYHTGVEINGREYTFAGSAEASGCGIQEQSPKVTPPGSQWVYNQTVDLGKTKLTDAQVRSVLSALRPDFAANTYDLVSKNCNHFSEVLTGRLGLQFPSWVNRAAKLGNALKGGVDPVQREAMRAEQEKQRQAEAERKRQVKQKEQKILESKQQALKQEPPPEAEGVVLIQINCPNGTKTKRRFLNTDTIRDVKAFTRAFDLSLGSEPFQLRNSYPRKVYSDDRQTLMAAGLGTRENLMVVRGVALK